MKNLRSTLVLLLIAALMGTYIWKNERGAVVEQGAVELLRIEPAQVTNIELRAAKSSLILRKSGAQWTISKPQMTPVPADAAVINRLLQPLTLLQSEAVVPQGIARLKEYGLDAPPAALNVEGRKLEFGAKPSFDASRVYARVGNQVALVPAALLAAASQGFEAWRDTRVLPFDADKVVGLRIRTLALKASFRLGSKDNYLELQDKGEKVWLVSSGRVSQARADRSLVSSFLSTLSQARAVKFLDDNPQSLKPWSLDQPTTIVVQTARGELTLSVGRKMNGGYAARNSLSPAVFLLPDVTFGLINRPLAAWRARDLITFGFDHLDYAMISWRGIRRMFHRDASGKWRLDEAAPKLEDSLVNNAVLDLLLAAQALRAESFLDTEDQTRFDWDHSSFQLWLRDEQEDQQILRITTKNGKVYARITRPEYPQPGDQTIFVLAPDALEPFQNGLKALFPTQNKTIAQGKS